LVLLISDPFHFLSHQISESLEIYESIGFGAHDEITPDSRGGDRVIDLELKWTMEADHTLNDMVWRWVVIVCESDADAEPPSQWLYEFDEHRSKENDE
jgi:hypothetical protein